MTVPDILNEALNWTDDIGDMEVGGNKVKLAFQLMFGDPTKERLPAGMRLYKFNHYSSLAESMDEDTLLSPWWSPVHVFKHDAGLAQRISIAKKNGVSLREWGRLTSVVKENWNSLEYLLIIELKVPVYGWFGGFKGMNRVDRDKDGNEDSKRKPGEARSKRSKHLPGGGTQFFIPNLQVRHVAHHEVRSTDAAG